jgi:hypothetical protein
LELFTLVVGAEETEIVDQGVLVAMEVVAHQAYILHKQQRLEPQILVAAVAEEMASKVHITELLAMVDLEL